MKATLMPIDQLCFKIFIKYVDELSNHIYLLPPFT